MNNKIISLIQEYQKMKHINEPIQQNFIDYCALFLKSNSDFAIKEIENEITKKDHKIGSKFLEITKITTCEYKIIKALLLLSSLKKIKRKKISSQNKSSHNTVLQLKKGALGFKIGVFDDYAIYKSKDLLEPHIYEVVFNIYQVANIYKRLKNQTVFVSKAQMNFNYIVEQTLENYEKKVIEQNESNGILAFYLNLYTAILDMQHINQINECFKENPKNPYSALKKICQGMDKARTRFESKKISHPLCRQYKDDSKNCIECDLSQSNKHNIALDFERCDMICADASMSLFEQDKPHIKNHNDGKYYHSIMAQKIDATQVNARQITPFYIVNAIEMIICTHLNQFVNQFINTGTFLDPENEFFITKIKNKLDLWDVYTIDFGLIPYFIKETDAIKINYIGKSMYIMNKINKHETFYDIDIFSFDLTRALDKIIESTNKKIVETLFCENLVYKTLSTVKNVFLFGRSDFVNTLSALLKDYNRHENKNLLNRSISYILENAMIDTFGELSDLMKKIDVCILENETSWNSISLFCQLDFPLNLILTKEIILKLVSIFKFLWRVKKIEGFIAQLRKKEFETASRIKLIAYNNLINMFMFYLCFEVIENEFVIDIEVKGMIIDDTRHRINSMLDKILLLIFQVPEKGKNEVDTFFGSLETLLMSIGRTNVTAFTDDDVMQNLNNFVTKNGYLFTNTSLNNLKSFL